MTTESTKSAKSTKSTEENPSEAKTPAQPAPVDGAGALISVLLQSVAVLYRRIVAAFGRWEDFLTGSHKATYGIAMTRILLGVTGLGLLLTNFASRHYSFGVGSAWNGEMDAPRSDFPDIWLFSLYHQAAATPWLFTLLYILLACVAVLITLGWRTRIVLPIYLVLWVSFIEVNDVVGDQGDNAYRMFLLAMVFTSSSMRWSLDARRRAKAGKPPTAMPKQWEWTTITAHNLALVVLAFQVCAIYVSGGLYKVAGDPWAHGYAIYDPLQTAQFGTWPVLSDLMTAWGPAVALMTWGSLMFQIAFPFLLFNRYTKIIALLGILSFHIAIGVLMGLPWFSLTMIAVDAIFVRDRSYQKLGRGLSFVYRSLRAGASSAAPGTAGGAETERTESSTAKEKNAPQEKSTPRKKSAVT